MYLEPEILATCAEALVTALSDGIGISLLNDERIDRLVRSCSPHYDERRAGSGFLRRLIAPLVLLNTLPQHDAHPHYFMFEDEFHWTRPGRTRE